MYLVSPKMTLIMLTALPVFITIGSIFGAILRHVSLQAQEQGILCAYAQTYARGQTTKIVFKKLIFSKDLMLHNRLTN